MNFINQYDLDALPYVDHEYDEPYMQSIVNNLILEEMKQFSPSTNYLSHLPTVKDISFGHSEALMIAYERAAISSSSGATSSSAVIVDNPDRIDVLKRYQPASIQNPEGPLKNDLQAWRRNLTNAKVQNEYNANQLMNLEIQAELMQKQELGGGTSAGAGAGTSAGAGAGAGNALNAFWLQHVNAVSAVFDSTLPSMQSKQKRQIDEVNRARYSEQMAVREEIERLYKRRCVALENTRQLQGVLSQRQAQQ